MTHQEIQYITSFEKKNRDDVTARVQDGRTRIFTDRKTAAAHARATRSYLYDLFCSYTIPGQRSKRTQYGYAVPK